MKPEGQELRRIVRLRPGMYIGDTEATGLHTLVFAVAHAGLVAAREGRVREVSVHLGADGSCSVTFDGWPWPVPTEDGAPAEAERRLTLGESIVRFSHYRSPFEDLGMINALSSSLVTTVWSGGRTWRQAFREGVPLEGMRPVPLDEAPPASGRGMRIAFTPDATVFAAPRRLLPEVLVWRLRDLAALQAGTTWRLSDETSGRRERFHFERGLADLCSWLSASSRPLHTPWTYEGHAGTTHVRLALQWCEGTGAGIVSWVNLKRCFKGTHHEGLLRGIHEAFAQPPAAPESVPGYSYWPTARGRELTAVLDVTLAEPLWKGPVMGNLRNEEVDGHVFQLVSPWLARALAEHPDLKARVLEQAFARFVSQL